ncbi:MAG: AI-2E family transporter, partial [Verrucomicrobiota bacterium]
MNQPTPFQQRTLWNAATGVSIMVLGALMVGLVWLIGKVFGVLQPVLIPLIVAGIVAYVLDPVVRLLQKRGLSRLWSVVTVFAAILAFVALLVIALIPAVDQGRGLLKKTFSKPTAEQQAIVESKAITAEASSDQEQNERLAGTLASELMKMRQRHQDNPIGWMLTEVDDQGNPVT